MFGFNKARFIEMMNRIFQFPDDVLDHLYQIYASYYKARLLRWYYHCNSIMSTRQLRDDDDDDDEPWIPLKGDIKWTRYGPGF